ncbi:MAG: GTP-binding protein [Solobacterium sp.]|nr:GTP-binding protein [Solobacterium sp.]
MTKVNVISGFLGAGKTTLIQKLLKDVFANQKVVLVENEFGEIGIDGGFLQDVGIEITEINSGCICCTLKGDFEESLKQVKELYQPDHIIIEPSGVGKLSDILRAIQSVDGLEIDSYSTVVDAARCKVYHKNFKEFFDDQIETANCIILSRTQLVDETKLQEDVDIIHSLNPEARIITTPWDELSGQAIFDAMTGATTGFPEGLEDDDDEHDHEEHEHHHEHDEHEHHHHEHCEHHHEHCEHDHEHCEHDHEHCECDDEHCECEHHHHDHDHEHHHDHEHEHHHHDNEEKERLANEGLSEGNRVRLGKEDHEHHHHHHHHGHDADEVFDSIGIETVNKYTEHELRTVLSKLTDNIVRAKGIVPSSENSDWLFFDYVPGDIDIRKGSPAYTGLITVIGEKVDIEAIKNLFGVK